MTACARCGDCCEHIMANADPYLIVDRIAEGDPGEDFAFIFAHWDVTAGPDRLGRYTYRCRRFDTETRTCTAHDDRPHVCRDFPWYEDAGDVQKMAERSQYVHERCSFHRDVPPDLRRSDARPLLPLFVV